MSNWQQKTLEEIADFINGLWKGKKPPFIEVGVIRNTNFINDGTINDKDIAYLNVERKQYATRRLQYGDLILERSGGSPKQPVGRVVFFDKKIGEFSFSNFTSLIRAKKEIIHPKFLLYFLLNFYKLGNTERLQKRTTGIRNLDFNEYKQTIINFPDLSLQKQIAQILSTLQSKVELVDKQIKLYEELKKSTMGKLFSEGLYGENQKETEIGLIPESWEVKKFDNLCFLQRGKDLPKRDFIDGKIPVAGSNGVIGYHNKFTTEAIGVTVGRSGSVGKTNIYFTNFWAHNTVLYVKDFFENDRVFTYYYLDYLNLQKYSSGVSVPTLNRNVFSSILISIPPLKEQKEISDILEKIDQKIKKLTSKKKSYQQLFNSMLHKLMNQEIDVVEW